MAPRFSPPKDKMEFIKSLVTDASPFSEYRDVLFFAAMLGWHGGRRVPLKSRGEAIRWDVMANRHGTEMITDMIAVATAPDDPSILANDRIDDRVAILEEYANGGLEILEERVTSAGAIPLEAIFIRLTQDALKDQEEDKPVNLVEQILNL